MENNYYQIYVDSIQQLVSSIVIKSNDTAVALNKELLVLYGPNAVNDNDMTSWRYYLNVSGQYHYADTAMTVVSLDTLETINFTKENLLIHTGTANAYVYGTRNYKELLNRYPLQERLILGILYPVDIDEAVNAKEGKILSFPSGLIEDNEYSFVTKLQTWIDGYLIRWNNPQFMLSDNLYAAAMYATMFMQMVSAILNIRLAACKTNEAHSYHIRQYLASNGMLDSFMTYLSRKQMLFLYRNIAYIMRNSGKAAVFEWLTEHIMTQRGLPLADFQMRHDLTNQPAELRPLLNFRKRPLNTDYNIDQRNIYSVPEVLVKEDLLARDNLKYHDDNQTEVISKMQNSLSNKIQTKLLESTTIDYSGSEHYTLADTLLYHWMLLSNNGSYLSYINVEQPNSGEIVSLRANKAFELYIYAFCKSIDIELVHLPLVMCKRVMRIPKPVVSDLMSVVNPKIVDVGFAQQMLDYLPLPQVHVSTISFYNWCKKVWQGALLQYYATSSEEGFNVRAQKHALISRCWSDTQIQLGTANETYSAWFTDLNMDISSYSRSDLLALCSDILKKATGLDSGSIVKLKDIQQAMVRLMSQLGSYSVQYSSEINDQPIMDAPNATIRPDNFRIDVAQRDHVLFNERVLEAKTEVLMSQEFDIGESSLEIDLQITQLQTANFTITPKVDFDNHGLTYYYTQQYGFEVTYDLPLPEDNPRGLVPVLGTVEYLQLTLEQQLSFPDIYHG